MRKSVKILAALLSAALLLTGCQGGGDKPTSTTDSGTDKTETIGTFITAVQGDPSSFNPDMKSDDYLWPMAQNLFNRLYKLAPGDVPIPDLATSYEWSDDNMTLTFHLRDGVKWHDGEPLTSKDVKWTYDTIIENKWAKSDTFVNVDTIEAPDDLTVVFNMKNPDAGLVPLLAWYATFILPEHIWNDPAYPDFAKNPAMQKPIGSGPFKFVEYKSGQSVTLERNEDFFGGAPEIERLIYQIMPDLNTTLEAFKNGEIDYITSLPTANLHDFDNDPNYEVFSFLSINRTYLTFNMEKEPFNNPKLRQAVAYAVDRQAIVDRMGNGVSALPEYFISPLFKDYLNDDYKLPERDIAKAQALMEECGLKKNAEGYYLTVTLDAFENGNFKDVAAIVQPSLKEAGIKVDLNLMEYAAWTDQVKEGRKFNMTMLAGYQGPDISGIYMRVGINGSNNFTGYASDIMEAALEKGAQNSDPAIRKEAYDEVQRLMSEDMPMVLLIDNGQVIPVKSKFDGTPYQVPDKAATSEFTYVTLKK